MSYAIANVMYGLPMISDDDDIAVKLDELLVDADRPKADQVGFHQFYSGSSSVVPAAFGLMLSKFNEACYSIDLATLALAPTEKQLRLFNVAWASLDENVQQLLKTLGEPRTFILWSTS